MQDSQFEPDPCRPAELPPQPPLPVVMTPDASSVAPCPTLLSFTIPSTSIPAEPSWLDLLGQR
ncbi:MAG: hypothetical protein VKK98_03885 [Cyanobacteriota bacterium]|nr:hypothetical protein [Cyanobacteriota bacterium]